MRKVLIIDDDAKNIFALSATLTSRGIANKSANSATDGLEILKEDSEIGLVLLDMMMPGMDGYEAIRHIREMEQNASLPVIAVTAQAMKGDREKCLEAGADDYISKPINVDLLLNKLDQYLKISSG